MVTGPRTAATLAAAVVCGAALAAVPSSSSVATPASTLTGAGSVGTSYLLRGDSGFSEEIGVMAEPALGRVEVHTFLWDEQSGRYLHLGLGSTRGGTCVVRRWVVVDTEDTDPTPPTVHDAAGASLPVVDYPVGDQYADDVVRLSVAPFHAVDCVRASGHDSGDPAHAGPGLVKAPAHALHRIGFSTHGWTLPTDATCPDEIGWNQTFDVGVQVVTHPGATPEMLWPSHLGTISFGFADSDDYTLVSSPDLPSGIDLWTADPWSGTYVFQAAPSATYDIDLGLIRHTRDGAVMRKGCNWDPSSIPVSVPAPTDWQGSLAGETWWFRDADTNSGIGEYRVHRTLDFLDDEWVVIGGEADDPAPEPCTVSAAGTGYGCHRYYFDAATHRFQIEDRRARPRASGNAWSTPESWPTPLRLNRTHTVQPVTTGERFAYEGTSLAGDRLTLRADGTYRYAVGGHTSRGSYRFDGAAQTLVLHRPGADLTSPVHLFYGIHDGKRRLFDIESDTNRLFRFGRW